MTNRAAFFLGAIILAAIAADVFANDAFAVTFLIKKFVDMIEYFAFWR